MMEFNKLVAKLHQELNYDFYWAVNETSKMFSKVLGDRYYDDEDLEDYDLGERDDSLEGLEPEPAPLAEVFKKKGPPPVPPKPNHLRVKGKGKDPATPQPEMPVAPQPETPGEFLHQKVYIYRFQH